MSGYNNINGTSISVIICVYNEEKVLNLCIESLVNQKFPKSKYELIIIDDESSDNTSKIAKEWADILEVGLLKFTYIRITHGGLSIARNTGIKYSKGEIIAFIDGDAVADKNWIEELSKPFYRDNADFVGGKIELLNSNSKVAQLAQLTRHKQAFGPRVFLNQLIGCNMAYRRYVFDCLGGFCENFVSRGDETSLYIRIKDSFQYKPASKAIVYHERLEKMAEWIKTEWTSGTNWGLTRKAGAIISIRFVASWFESAFIVLQPFFVILALFNSVLFTLVALSLIGFCRRVFIRPVSRKIIGDLISYYGKYKAYAIIIIYTYVTTFISCWGNLIGLWKYRNDTLIPPMTTESQILEKMCNDRKVVL